MAKAGSSSIANSWPVEGRLIDVACQLLLTPFWHAYAQVCTGVRDLEGLRRARIANRQGRGKLRLKLQPNAQDWLNASNALDGQVHRLLEEGEFELWGRRGSPTAQVEPIPASAFKRFEIDYENQIAEEETGLKHFDLRMVRIAPQTANRTAVWLYGAARRLKMAGKIPEDIGPQRFAKILGEEMRKAAKTVSTIKPVGWGHIKNNLKNWGLWPISRIK